MKTLFPMRVVLRLTALLLAAHSSLVGAAPPGGGGATSSGKILFSAGDTYYSMNADGSSKLSFSPAINASRPRDVAVSAKLYQGGRWMLQFEETTESFPYCDHDGNLVGGHANGVELFAYRWNGETVDRQQLTRLSRWGLRRQALWSEKHVVWSNDYQDSFFSITLGGWDVIEDETGLPMYVSDPDRPRYIVRIRLQGSDLDRNVDTDSTNDFPLIGTVDPRADMRFEIVVESLVSTMDTFYSHSWDPSGTRLLYSDGDGSGVYTLRVRDVFENSDTPILSGITGVKLSHQWSPDLDTNAAGYQGKLVLGYGNSIAFANSDGTGLKTVRASSSSRVYGEPYWSPDGKWIAYQLASGVDSFIAKYPAAGGKEAVLTKDVTGPKMSTLGWTKE